MCVFNLLIYYLRYPKVDWQVVGNILVFQRIVKVDKITRFLLCGTRYLLRQ